MEAVLARLLEGCCIRTEGLEEFADPLPSAPSITRCVLRPVVLLTTRNLCKVHQRPKSVAFRLVDVLFGGSLLVGFLEAVM